MTKIFRYSLFNIYYSLLLQTIKVNPSKYLLCFFIIILSSCNKDDEIKYANGYPSKLAGNWVVFQFQGGNLDGALSSPYEMVTALAPNDYNTLILDNLYNTNTRIKAKIQGDTGFVATKTEQLEVLNLKNKHIVKISIDGYIKDNFVLKDYIYSLARSSFPNMAFTEDDITEIIFFRAGFYDVYGDPVDSVMVMGYRKTGFEDEKYN
jgi:hypothetical protein